MMAALLLQRTTRVVTALVRQHAPHMPAAPTLGVSVAPAHMATPFTCFSGANRDFHSRTAQIRQQRNQVVRSFRGPASQLQALHGIPWLTAFTACTSAVDATPSTVAVNELPTDLDAIVVLAGGLLPDGSCPPWVKRRLDTAAGIWKCQSDQKSVPILCLGSGTPHKPPILDVDGYVVHESTACADYLIQRSGVPASCILKEVSSYDTVGNAYFALVIHALPAGWRKVAVVTSAFHMPRTKALFATMWSAAARDVAKDAGRFTLCFAAAADEGLWGDDSVLAARHAKEAAALGAWMDAAAQFKSFQDLHAWLFATHQCYAVSRQHEAHKQTITDPKLLASY